MKNKILKYALSIVQTIQLLSFFFFDDSNTDINYCIAPLLVAGLVLGGVSIASKVGSMLTKKNPYTKYKLDTQPYNPMLSRVPGYQMKSPQKVGYTFNPNNSWSKGLDTTSTISGVLSAAAGGAAALGLGAGTTAATTGTTAASNAVNLGQTTAQTVLSGWSGSIPATTGGFGAGTIAADIPSFTGVAATPTVGLGLSNASTLGLSTLANTATNIGVQAPTLWDKVDDFRKGYNEYKKPLDLINTGLDKISPKSIEPTKDVSIKETGEEEQPTGLDPTTPVMQGGIDFKWGIDPNYAKNSLSGIGAGVIPNTVSRGVSNPNTITMNSINDYIKQMMNRPLRTQYK